MVSKSFFFFAFTKRVKIWRCVIYSTEMWLKGSWLAYFSHLITFPNRLVIIQLTEWHRFFLKSKLIDFILLIVFPLEHGSVLHKNIFKTFIMVCWYQITLYTLNTVSTFWFFYIFEGFLQLSGKNKSNSENFMNK